MKVIYKLLEMQEIAISIFKSGKKVGLVPTMGALHRGHLSLVEKSLLENDITIVTIFINPIQFAPGEDLAKYPLTIELDKEKLEKFKVDYLFIPSKEEIYPEDFLSTVKVKVLTEKLCGIYRSSHFEGVTSICCKLFNITMPRIAYFGQKDYQQYLVIRQMIKDLNMPLKIKLLPIIRDKDGLALSSRNMYLNDNERAEAINLYKGIREAEDCIRRGERDSAVIKSVIAKILSQSKLIEAEYISVSCASSLEEIIGNIPVPSSILLASAIRIGDTRLIDNALIDIS